MRVAIAGGTDDGLTVDVVNTRPATSADGVSGSGRALVGLAERVALGGGRPHHGPDAAGGFTVHAWLPWPP